MVGDVDAESEIAVERSRTVRNPAGDIPPALAAFMGGLKGQTIEIGLTVEYEGQPVASSHLLAQSSEQLGERLAEKLVHGNSEQVSRLPGEEGQTPLPIGRPK